MATLESDRLRELRRSHERLVVAELARSGPLSRAELIRRSGLSRTTLFAIVADLVTAGTLVAAVPETASRRARGRPTQLVTINPGAGTYLGVDIGRAHVHIVIVNAAHEIVARGSTAFPADAAGEDRLARAHELVGNVTARDAVSLDNLRGVGLALQGPVDPPTATRHRHSERLRDSAARAANSIRTHYNVPVHVDNNTHAAAVAERIWGIARGITDLLYIRCSDGVSSGIIADGHLLRGAHGLAGEIGHVQVEPQGPACYCGNHGCLEQYLGVPGLIAACASRGQVVPDAAALVDAAHAGNPTVQSVVAEAIRRLATVVAATAAQLDPSHIILAGKMAALGDLITTPVRDAVAQLSLPAFRRDIEVAAATVGEDAAALGAVAQLLRAEAPEALVETIL